jgi:hypothetical protein
MGLIILNRSNAISFCGCPFGLFSIPCHSLLKGYFDTATAYHGCFATTETERVQTLFAKIQLFELAAARMTALKMGGLGYAVLYFSVKDLSTAKKYGNTTDHQYIILCIVLFSQGTCASSLMTDSIVSAQ